MCFGSQIGVSGLLPTWDVGILVHSATRTTIVINREETLIFHSYRINAKSLGDAVIRHVPSLGCKDQQKAATALGYAAKSWDNLSGQETQPSSGSKYWAELTAKEQEAATVLGYTGKSWDNESGQEKQPASSALSWRQLKSCGKFVHTPLVVNISVSLII